MEVAQVEVDLVVKVVATEEVVAKVVHREGDRTGAEAVVAAAGDRIKEIFLYEQLLSQVLFEMFLYLAKTVGDIRGQRL